MNGSIAAHGIAILLAREELEFERPILSDTAIIGEVVEDHPGMVLMKTGLGGFRVVDMLTGEQLPRIC